jgi:hypothetical protein
LPRNPPQSAAQHASSHQEWQPKQKQNMCKLVPQLPSADFAPGLNHPILRLAKVVESALRKQVQR